MPVSKNMWELDCEINSRCLYSVKKNPQITEQTLRKCWRKQGITRTKSKRITDITDVNLKGAEKTPLPALTGMAILKLQILIANTEIANCIYCPVSGEDEFWKFDVQKNQTPTKTLNAPTKKLRMWITLYHVWDSWSLLVQYTTKVPPHYWTQMGEMWFQMKLCDVESVQISPAHAVKYANLQENIQEDVGQDRQQQGSHVLPPTTRDCKIVQIVTELKRPG